MDLKKDMNITLFKKKNKNTLPNKKSMNLYQPDYSNDPKRILTIAGIVIFIIALVLTKVLVIDKINELNAYEQETIAMSEQYNAMLQKVSGYAELKEEYYRYSESFANGENPIYDRLDITRMLRDVTEDVAEITSTTINSNLVNIKVITKDLDDLGTFRKRLENISFVKDVTVYSAVRDTGDVTSSVAFKCIVEEDE